MLCCLQYVQLAFTMYEQYYYYAAALLSITLLSGFASTFQLYRKRLQLFQAVAQRHLVPIVQAGLVRYAKHQLVGDLTAKTVNFVPQGMQNLLHCSCGILQS